MSDLTTILRAKRAALRIEVDRSKAAVTELRHDLAIEESRLLSVEAQLELVAELIVEDSAVPAQPTKPAPEKPSQAVLRLVGANPGIDVAAVAEMLGGRSRQRRHVMRSTCGNLVKAERLFRFGRKLYPVPAPRPPRYVSWDWQPGWQFYPCVIRGSAAVRMASRSLPNPSGETRQ